MGSSQRSDQETTEPSLYAGAVGYGDAAPRLSRDVADENEDVAGLVQELVAGQAAVVGMARLALGTSPSIPEAAVCAADLRRTVVRHPVSGFVASSRRSPGEEHATRTRRR
ncbi:hypothetical protein [Streptomyces griseosporeus]|uniref:hypothetical protein n=1 Tax=Streptomyces griseosporeus TaxID=1910 RepID=UPI0036FFBE54